MKSMSQDPLPKIRSKTGWVEVEQEWLDAWKTVYTWPSIVNAIQQAAVWCINNPNKRKVDVRRFLSNWISKSADVRARPAKSTVVNFQGVPASRDFGNQQLQTMREILRGAKVKAAARAQSREGVGQEGAAARGESLDQGEAGGAQGSGADRGQDQALLEDARQSYAGLRSEIAAEAVGGRARAQGGPEESDLGGDDR
jgi:hypothetical protein